MVQKLPASGPLAPLLEQIGCDPVGVRIMAKKAQTERFIIKNLSCAAANILKQDALSIGAELAVPAGVVNCSLEKIDAVLMATPAQLERLVKKESIQPFGLKKVAEGLRAFLSHPVHPLKIMGVLNLNKDSFNAASRVGFDDVLKRAEAMIEAGAQMLDIGAVSSRPGSDPVSAQEELARLKPAIDAFYAAKLHEKAVLSLDSYEPIALEYALDRGFSFVNDITGGRDDRVVALAAKYNATLCIMHMQGDPKTMQLHPRYEDVVAEVDAFFAERIIKAQAAGVKNLALDVGIGFGKTLEHNLKLINAHGHFLRHGLPMLIGASRKSMIDAITPAAVADRLPGTLAVHLKAVENGASIVRCHDVAEHAQALRVYRALLNQQP
ncbi:MAG: dihydropteroate synthase [Campylobacterales bacterium]